ncbi:hypothetical protein [Speluncibacter jeojiensis]|uniref:Uncharacterized protein n=1 Tax=Speluncibacter jeojiensis TaxID=2710754 RepID=A0A9X4M3U6_9ACTN|nr:hypothetical protein [Corynebacteriales bacterium D3-21]
MVPVSAAENGSSNGSSGGSSDLTVPLINAFWAIKDALGFTF